jgi:hypothetical protein
MKVCPLSLLKRLAPISQNIYKEWIKQSNWWCGTIWLVNLKEYSQNHDLQVVKKIKILWPRKMLHCIIMWKFYFKKFP